MIVGTVCKRKPGAWESKPSCPHFARCEFIAGWRDEFTGGERLLEIPLCSECYGKYVKQVEQKYDEQYAKAEREAGKLLKIDQVLKLCRPLFESVTA